MENDTARGSYAPVVHSQPGLKHRLSVGRRLLQLAPLVAFCFGGASLMLIHHIFNAHLNEKRIDPGSSELPSFLTNQKNANLIGTTIAHGARILLAMAIGATSTQLFWETLRSRSHTITQIDAFISCRHSPFLPSAVRAVQASLALYAISVAASATALIVVLSPGSLTISTDFQRERPCTVPTVPQEVTVPSYSGSINSPIFLILRGMLLSNSYLPPFQDNLASVCGDGLPSCSYDVSFVGPALDCIDITNKTDFTSFLTPALQNSLTLTQTAIWNASWNNGYTGITILSRDPTKNLVQATNCSAYNATYDVNVNLEENAAATVRVHDVNRDSYPLQDNSFINYYAQWGLAPFSGECFAGPIEALVCSENIFGSFIVTTETGNLTFADSVSHFATSFIQNTSISLLSGNIDYNYSNDIATNLQYVNSTCSSPVSVYVYNSTRLLSAYGVTLTVTMMLVVHGCRLISRNGGERDLLFSDVIEIALNDDMIRTSEQSSARGMTWIKLSRADYGQRRLVVSPKTMPSDLDGPSESAEAQSKEFTARRRRKFLTGVQRKMALLILGLSSSMGLNHTFYRHIHGKGPSPSLSLSESSGWLMNQTIVSDIGIALAYAGQTFLAITIATSSNQSLWRSMRNRGHSISGIDSVMRVQTSPYSLSIISALRTSLHIPLLSLLAASTALISILAPGSIKITPNLKELKDCTILTPRNMSAWAVNTTIHNLTDGNSGLLQNVFSSGTYLPPVDACGSSPTASQCSYDLNFIGPGFECEDGPVSSSYSAFTAPFAPGALFQADIMPQTVHDLTLRMFVQTWDEGRSMYQSANCTGVLRSHSISISQANNPTINVTAIQTMSIIHANISQPLTFADIYVSDMMNLLARSASGVLEGKASGPPFSSTGCIGIIQLDGNITWNQNLARSLEEFSQNVTLSILSGDILTFNSDVPDILENSTTTCTYTFTAYEYTPLRLFLTYGIGILVAVLCTIWGSFAIHKNGVDESMDFSRLLRAILNERMYNTKDTLDKDSIIKADETPEGALAPVDS